MHKLTRRDVASLSLGLSPYILTAGCGVVASAPSTRLFIQSALLIPSAVNLATNAVSTHVIDPFFSGSPKVTEAAEAAGANKDVCKATEQIMGTDVVLACLKNKIAIWASYNKNVQETSYFDLTLKSHSSDRNKNSGQIVFGIVDIETGELEVDGLWGPAFGLLPYETQSLRYGPYTGQQFRLGAKKIIVRSAPTDVSVAETMFIVLPMAVES